jgi:hypothetical protein
VKEPGACRDHCSPPPVFKDIIMNTQSLIAAIAFAFAGTAAMAQEVTVDTKPFHATRTRAEVRAEVLQAHRAGVLQFSTELETYIQPLMATAPSTLTREQVRAEAREQARSPRRSDSAYSAA